MPEESLDRLHTQQRAVKVLEQLLARIANEKLPVITWTLSSDNSQVALIGTCDSDNADQRHSDFEAWRDALSATELPPEAASGGGTRLKASVIDHYQDVAIALIADV
ncbi:hypothetical protein [Nonomuraea roseoviolacea]|uniref:Uncharacterized protein n=1 Tax=Nonomuraea roseoviolacea subsp. carminata TaxID=160689 RepID=A0ABT1JTS2_9ACTN|nr:hypothetical protein [Nonomuraea roseoviolacea]MCP2345137.1 hypothetical protein [Nonomuraea roseoviolacea subsp. carminata]